MLKVGNCVIVDRVPPGPEADCAAAPGMVGAVVAVDEGRALVGVDLLYGEVSMLPIGCVRKVDPSKFPRRGDVVRTADGWLGVVVDEAGQDLYADWIDADGVALGVGFAGPRHGEGLLIDNSAAAILALEAAGIPGPEWYRAHPVNLDRPWAVGPDDS